ncbi:hypothetical protein HGP17_04605 [Rhizobium sp. P38BS-XIX]|uniref:hypothetical protein n=1 Tax=Rhizobium sp. P38BS-XIX TaxID=2726740 RepID=UPI001456E1A9|nr:hypothetical protein [Rhizobium sp. P38BS-XIX]NLR96108.1 hypothetical protein [Rhizobium sp. P38BS-XIX]
MAENYIGIGNGLQCPLAVAAATNHSTDTVSALSVCAIVVATIGALIEGIRRIYRFEQRWATLNAAKRAIFSARETYRAKSIDLVMGSAEWQVIYYDFKNAYENATSQQASIFFKGLTSPGEGGAKGEDEKSPRA